MANDTHVLWLDAIQGTEPDALFLVAEKFVSAHARYTSRTKEPSLGCIGLLCDFAETDGAGPHAYRVEDQSLADLQKLYLRGWLREDAGGLNVSLASKYVATPMLERRIGRSRQSIPKSTQLAVYQRDNFKCWLCGIEARPEEGLSYKGDWEPVCDHVIPHCFGGSNRADNLRAAHSWCNLQRGNRSPGSRLIWRARQIHRASTASVVLEAFGKGNGSQFVRDNLHAVEHPLQSSMLSRLPRLAVTP